MHQDMIQDANFELMFRGKITVQPDSYTLLSSIMHVD